MQDRVVTFARYETLDLLIIGSGVAGLSAAVRAETAEPGLRVGVICKGRLSDSATQWAQGGVAAVLHSSEAELEGGAPGAGGSASTGATGVADSPELHLEDTLRAGAGLCDAAAVDVLVREGPVRVRELARLGAEFDRNEDGRWSLAREGGHSTARVVHAGGAATGAEVERALVDATRAGAVLTWEDCFAADLVVENGRCAGATVRGDDGKITTVRATNTLLATGGAGQLFPVTTNPPQATADGIAMALRAGVAVADVEFVQFHPTALYAHAGSGPRTLMSEALRGEGALLRDARGERFVDELQPRDIVAAAVWEAMSRSDLGHVWLDVSPIASFGRRFPTLAAAAASVGLDPSRDWLPVAPAAHYLCGGIMTDLDGATTLPGLWAAGEAACTGVHGANRLASNSLLEGMVFAARAVEAILVGRDAPAPTGVLRAILEPDPGGRVAGAGPAGGEGPGAPPMGTLAAVPLGTARPSVRPLLPGTPHPSESEKAVAAVQQIMADGAGVVRSARSLSTAAAELSALAAQDLPGGEAANLLDVARAVVSAAAAREESRGGHRRSDFPLPSVAMVHRFVHR